MWYVARTGNHQRLVIEEDTGETIAVAYDKKDASLLAAAPELLALLSNLKAHHSTCWSSVTRANVAWVMEKAEGRN